MCSVDDVEPATVWHQTTRTARVRHECGECRRWIQPGERYQHVRALWDDHWGEFKTCQHCSAAGVWLNMVCGGYIVENLLEEMREHWDGGYRSVGVGRLIVGIKRRWHNGRDAVPDKQAVRALAESMMRAQVAA